MIYPEYQSDVKVCQAICEHYGTSYALATRFFPRRVREATYVLYAFYRVPDELVDQLSPVEAAPSLAEWRSRVEQALKRGESTNEPVLRAMQYVMNTFMIPYHYVESFLQAMEQDLDVASYQTYEDLKQYMYGSASVVGMMMSYVIGFKGGALKAAEEMGYAMQLTNFLRDIREDYEMRGRIYIPHADMQKHGVSVADITHFCLTENVKQLLLELVERARGHYETAEAGIHLLALRGRFPVRLASGMYAGILDKIEAAKMDIFSGRVYTTKQDKFNILLKTLFKPYVKKS